jgi:2-haloacid dehalogenase
VVDSGSDFVRRRFESQVAGSRNSTAMVEYSRLFVGVRPCCLNRFSSGRQLRIGVGAEIDSTNCVDCEVNEMSDGRQIKALLFDVFGTVVDWRTGVTRELYPFLNRFAPQVDAAEFADAWRRQYSPAMEEIRSGRRPFVPLDVLHRENLKKVLSDYGVDSSSISAQEIEDLNFSWHRLDPWPDSVAGLLRLKRRFMIAPLSNGNIRLMMDMAKRAALPWDAILGAEVARAYKPSPEVYSKTVEILGLHPAEVCMVAAHNGDLAAARLCGLKTAFLVRPTEHGPGQTSDLHAEQHWDFLATDMNDLATQLGCPT